MYYILDEDRNPVRVRDVIERAKAFESMNRTVAGTTTPNGEVSTVFIGLDHARSPPPLLYETRVFGGPRDQWQQRYATEDEAKQGHNACVSALKYAQEAPCHHTEDVP